MMEIMDERRKEELLAFCQSNSIVMADLKLLHSAFTHTSYANECRSAQAEHNERLEFLGDAVLDLVISEYLFRKFPNLPEGELTKIRAQVVCEPTLAKRADEIGIGNYLLLGKGEATSGGRERISLLADAFEAVVGAIYLNSGLASAAEFVLRRLKADLNIVSRGEFIKEDYKTMLQEFVQKQSWQRINYEILAEYGPDHDKMFEVVVIVNNRRLGAGAGKSKKEAEQNAANEALKQLKQEATRGG